MKLIARQNKKKTWFPGFYSSVVENEARCGISGGKSSAREAGSTTGVAGVLLGLRTLYSETTHPRAFVLQK